MNFDETQTKAIFQRLCANDDARNHTDAFVQVCRYLSKNPDRVARSRTLDFGNTKEVEQLGKKYLAALQASVFPKPAKTVADPMVNTVLMGAFGHNEAQTQQIIEHHRQAMVAENCIGSLLERYLDSVLCQHGWAWCCGSLVRAVDFIRREGETWQAVQIKNRDNSENSSSSAIRNNTTISKWFRSFSATGLTNWDNLPEAMKTHGLSEAGFTAFVIAYLQKHKPNNPDN